MTDFSNVNFEASAPGSAASEIENDRAALSKALAAADKLAKLASTVKLHNRTLDGVREEE